MRKIPALSAMWCAAVAVVGPQDAARKAPSPPYTMATYQLVMLKPGPEAPRLGNTTEGNKVVQAHVQSIRTSSPEKAT